VHLKTVEDLHDEASTEKIRAIEALEGQLFPNALIENSTIEDGNFLSKVKTDIITTFVVNRNLAEKLDIAIIKNFGLKTGAIASSVAHDSHNIIAVGVSDEAICKAVNLIINHKGGICAVSKENENILSLPVAGIMSDKDGKSIGLEYAKLDKMAKKMGSKLQAPYMTLSFMALLVIPSLKISDKGLFNGNDFKFVGLGMEDGRPKT